ncbi:MAG: hypothetical protein GDA48_19615 [Hormoscilla sp. GM102CHS1]|nr:hypothetical protein [Hormoscilla sp. GM102CHS1]
MINGVMGSIGNMLDKPLTYVRTTYIEEEVEHLMPVKQSDANTTVLLAQARFDIEELQVQGDIVLFFDVGSFDALLVAIEQVG